MTISKIYVLIKLNAMTQRGSVKKFVIQKFTKHLVTSTVEVLLSVDGNI